MLKIHCQYNFMKKKENIVRKGLVNEKKDKNMRKVRRNCKGNLLMKQKIPACHTGILRRCIWILLLDQF